MPLIFWTKMNDIRLRPGYFLRLDACENHSPKPVKLTASDHPLFRPCIWSLKMWWSDASLDGALPPKRNTFTGVHLPSLGRVISFRPPVFPFLRWTLIRIKKKAYRPRFRLVKSLLATKQVCDFQRFRIVLLVSLHDVKNALRSPQNRSKLSA
ncbi:hypothetical protein J4727_20300 [Providencia rettgeri]|uniref:Uncharacterized protein n=1 Tax=Providencia rettgeri TaxID=587 RepID=A0A939NIB5_PRORE|nr:hypothetical protein [Providencia rettgeri]